MLDDDRRREAMELKRERSRQFSEWIRRGHDVMVNDDDCALKKAGRTPPSLSIILRIARENERRWCNTKRRAAISLPTR